MLVSWMPLLIAMTILVLLTGCTKPVTPVETEVSVGEWVVEASKEITPRYECGRTPTPVVIDGDLSEWADVSAIVLDQPQQAGSERGEWQGPQDCSGTARMSFDSDHLYLAFDTTDDVFHQPFTDTGIWAGDCVQFAIDSLEDRSEGDYAPDDHEFTVALTSGGPQLIRWAGPYRGLVESSVLAVVQQKEGGGLRYELAIPWAELTPLAPGLRKSFGFTFTFNDNDGKGIKSWLEWTPGIYEAKDPASYGQVMLKYTPPAEGKSELFVACDVPGKPDVEELKFPIFRFTPRKEKLNVKLNLTSDDKTVASSTVVVPVTVGANRREVTWKISELADGAYEGTITVQPEDGNAVVRNFTYQRLIPAPVRARVEAIRKGIGNLTDAGTELYNRHAPSLEYRMQVADTWLSQTTEIEQWQKLLELVAESEQIVEVLSRGADWFAEQRGQLAKAYRAPEDGSIQPYRLEVPPDYDGSKAYPLLVYLHGYGGKKTTFESRYVSSSPESKAEWRSKDNRHLRPGILVVHPYGRGNTGWRLLGRNDVFHVIDQVRRDYEIDENRVYVGGHSMGGGGTWHLASRFPDRWAACSPNSGPVGVGAWRRYQNEDTGSGDWQKRLSIANSNIFVLENLLNVPTISYHGLADPVVSAENTEAAFARLRQLDYEAILLASVRGQHGFPKPLKWSVVDWLLTYERSGVPKTVRYRTCDLRYNKAYWVEIDELIEEYRLSEVKANWSEPGKISLETTNVSRLSLQLPAELLRGAASLEIDVDGSKLSVGRIPKDRKLHLATGDGGKTWRQSDRQYRDGRIKRHGLSGPMSEALGDRFLIVYGTAGSRKATQVNRVEAEAFAKNLKGLTFGRIWGDHTVLADTELTPTQVRSAHLVLFGGPDSNAFTRRIAGELPLKVERGKLTFRGKTYDDPTTAVKFIYPNPAGPDRYVLVNCGASPEALRNIHHFVRSQPDWLTFDAESAKRRAERRGPLFADGGFFDRDWK